jgi:beta-glucosidase
MTEALPKAPMRVPPGFLWGFAQSAHQVEGLNTGSDYWLLEHLGELSPFAEPSGDACDFLGRYREDAALAASTGINAFRLSIEWARVEPEPGWFSIAAFDQYRRILEAFRERGLRIAVTFHHFTSPRWFASDGGWERESNAGRFARYCEEAVRRLGDLIDLGVTFNEPNVTEEAKAYPFPPVLKGEAPEQLARIRVAAARRAGSHDFAALLFGDSDACRRTMIAAHSLARDAMKGAGATFPIGLALHMNEYAPMPGGEARAAEHLARSYDDFLAIAAEDDFLGVQAYTRFLVRADGFGPAEGAATTLMGYEVRPQALEAACRYAAQRISIPLYVTENGIATDDDTVRQRFIVEALRTLQSCLDDKLDIRGYFHWSFLDNFEWMVGYGPRFGVVDVDHRTFERTMKGSAHLLGRIARTSREMGSVGE